jgi:hypothetical protein
MRTRGYYINYGTTPLEYELRDLKLREMVRVPGPFNNSSGLT